MPGTFHSSTSEQGTAPQFPQHRAVHSRNILDFSWEMGVFISILWLIPKVLISTDAPGQSSDSDICLVGQDQAVSQEYEAKSRSVASSLPYSVSKSKCFLIQNVWFWKRWKKVASPVPEVARDIWTVSGGNSVLSFNLTWKMKCKKPSMHNHTFFLFLYYPFSQRSLFIPQAFFISI